jgi:hypothetical protein
MSLFSLEREIEQAGERARARSWALREWRNARADEIPAQIEERVS